MPTMTLSTESLKRSRRALAANLFAADQRMQRRTREVVAEMGGKAYQRAYDICPKDTWFMVEHLRLRFTQGGLGWELGWQESDFDAAGLPFYPVYQEFGTVKMAAQPTIFPAHEYVRGEFQRKLATAIRQATRRRARG